MEFTPISAEAEQILVSSTLRNPEMYAEVSHIVSFKDFTDRKLGIIWDTIDSISRKGELPGLHNVIVELEASGRLYDAGGSSFVMDLENLVIGSYKAIPAAKSVAESASWRRLRKIGERLSLVSPSEKFPTAEDAQIKVMEEIGKFGMADARGSTISISEVADEFYDSFDENIKFHKSGFETFDNLAGGLRPGSLMIIGARPAVGKTSLALKMALEASKSGSPTVFFSLEMSKKEIIRRLIALDSGVSLNVTTNNKSFLSSTSSERASVASSLARLRELPFRVSDATDGSIEGISAEVKRLNLSDSCSFVVVDYLQLVACRSKQENRLQEVSKVSRELKRLALSVEIPVMALSQFARNAAEGTPKIHHLRESGAIEADSDLIMILQRASADADARKDMSVGDRKRAELTIAKHRHGPLFSLPLIFEEETANYKER